MCMIYTKSRKPWALLVINQRSGFELQGVLIFCIDFYPYFDQLSRDMRECFYEKNDMLANM